MTLPLDVPTAINQRRSIKTFTTDPIAPELLKTLVELTVAAPSSFNIQDWRIILVQEPAQKAALAEAAWGQKQIIQAPVTFVFAADAAAGGGDLTPIYEQALSTGAWSEGTVKYFKQAIPGFQKDLGEKTREYAIKDSYPFNLFWLIVINISRTNQFKSANTFFVCKGNMTFIF